MKDKGGKVKTSKVDGDRKGITVLKIIFENHDGFEIANQDLHLRGPGEFIGARQSGMPLLRYADLEDVAMVAAARRVAEQMLTQSPTQVDAHLARWLGGREDLLKA